MHNSAFIVNDVFGTVKLMIINLFIFRDNRTVTQQPMRVVVPSGTTGTQIIQTQIMPQAMLKQGNSTIKFFNSFADTFNRCICFVLFSYSFFFLLYFFYFGWICSFFRFPKKQTNKHIFVLIWWVKDRNYFCARNLKMIEFN